MATERRGRQSVRDLQVRLAEYLLTQEEGQRLPPIRKLAATTHMSVGAVSTALNGLEEAGAVKIQNRGHLGSLITAIARGKLWELVGQGPMVIGLTLPMHSRFEGLATGLKKSLENAGVETYLIFIRGSRTRLKALRENRCHATVMSGLAADELCGKEHQILLRLPPGSWISAYTIFYRQPQADRRLRVAIDPDSFDHRRLTEEEFAGQDVEYRLAPFVQFPRLLNKGEVDVILWTMDQPEPYIGPGVQNRPLSARTMQNVGDRSLSATVIGRAGDEAVRAIFQTAIHPQEVLDLQEKIVSGQMIPEY